MEAINTYTYKYTYIHIHVEDCALETIQVSKCTEKNIRWRRGSASVENANL